MLVERILVTGASRGIGRELVRRLLETDRAVIAICRDRHSADGLEASFAQFADGQLTTISADLAQSSAASIVERELTGVDQLDGLINCAGVNRGSGAIHDEATRSLDDLEANAINAMFQVNATTPLLLIATLRGRLGRAGAAKVINLTSSRATPGPGEGGKYGYRASKAALNIFTRGDSGRHRPRLGANGYGRRRCPPGGRRRGSGHHPALRPIHPRANRSPVHVRWRGVAMVVSSCSRTSVAGVPRRPASRPACGRASGADVARR